MSILLQVIILHTRENDELLAVIGWEGFKVGKYENECYSDFWNLQC